MIPETQLDTWSHQGSVQQSSSTFKTIKTALEAADTGYKDKGYEVFLQGSYGNDTNIYAESDVDVVISTDFIYYYDTSALKPQDLTTFNMNFVPGTYPYANYTADVIAALRKTFGDSVKPGNKAIKIEAYGNRRSTDVVVAAEFREYYSTSYGFNFHRGIAFFTSSGNRIVNYPKQHSTNCTAKHQATGGWFKPMVRILKNMRGKMIEKGLIAEGVAPSYFLEGLLYNVPANKFGNNYADTFVEAINWLVAAKREDLLCVNERYYLVRDAGAECWPIANYTAFLNGAVKLWKEWK